MRNTNKLNTSQLRARPHVWKIPQGATVASQADLNVTLGDSVDQSSVNTAEARPRFSTRF